MNRFSRWITLPLGSVSGAIVAALMMLTVIDIILRKIAGHGVPAIVEYSEVLLVVSVFFAIASAQVEGFHVSTTVFTSRLPLGGRRFVELAGAVLGSVVVACMALVATNAAWVSFATGEYRFGLAAVIVWPARAAVALGLWLYLIEYASGAMRRFKSPPAEPDAEDDLEKAEKGVIL
jgi:TRAP-type mannitol/chloroaromatic compound transport system permease small subunit